MSVALSFHACLPRRPSCSLGVRARSRPCGDAVSQPDARRPARRFDHGDVSQLEAPAGQGRRALSTGGGDLIVESIEQVRSGAITDADARRAGSADAAALRREMRWGDDITVLRIAFRREDQPGHRRHPPSTTPRSIGASTVSTRRAQTGPWTRATLDVIARRPAVRAGDLAAELGRERLSFKADVRKLKRLGLTESLDLGYRLSPRGRAYLDHR